MATKIVTKNSSTASAVPTASDLVQGELAVNVADKRLFTEDNAGAIVELGTNPSTIDINAGTIDGTAIGASSASTGAFTTLTATGAFTSVGIDDNATSTAITIDSSENVGIGTSSPDTQLTLYKASTNADVNYAKMRMDSWGGSTGKLKSIVWDDAGNSVAGIGAEYDGGKTNIHFHSQYSGGFKGTADRTMSIMGNGNVGIGTSSPSAPLHVIGNDGVQFNRSGQTNGFIIRPNASTDGIRFTQGGTGDRMTIDSSGNVGIGNTVASSMDGGANNLVIGSGSGTEGMTIYSGTTNSGTVYFADGASGDDRFRGQINYAHSDNSLNFRTNASSTPQMTLDSSGNVGIGTSSISGRLEIKKATASNEILFGIEASGVTTTTLGSITYDQSDDSMRLLNNSDFGGTTLRLGTRGNDNLVIDYSGNVGIGTSSPLGKLTISNAAGTNAPSTVTAANTYLQLGSDDYGPSNNGKFMIGFGYTDATNTNSPAYIGYEEASTSGDTYGDLTFYTRSVNTDTAPTERLRIDSSGNVGIGTSSPTQKLSLYAGVGYNADSALFSDFAINDGAVNNNAVHAWRTGITGNAAGHSLTFSTLARTQSAYQERMRIDSSGNVGIGTSSPSAKMHLESTSGNHLRVAYNSSFYWDIEREAATGSLTFTDDTAGEVMRLDGSGNVGIGLTNPSVPLHVNGDARIVGAYTSTTGFGANVFVQSTGKLFRSVSSARYKNSIEDATHGLEELLTLRPVTYKGNEDNDTVFGGLIAEEVHDVGLTEFVQYNEEGEPDALAYSNMVSLCIKAIQEQQTLIESLTARIAALEE